MNEDFQPDNAESCEDRNERLQDLLMGVWRYKCINKIERQHLPAPTGWKASFED